MHETEDLYIEGPIVLLIIRSFISRDSAVIPVHKTDRSWKKTEMKATEGLNKPEGCKPHVLMKKAYCQVYKFALKQPLLCSGNFKWNARLAAITWGNLFWLLLRIRKRFLGT